MKKGEKSISRPLQKHIEAQQSLKECISPVGLCKTFKLRPYSDEIKHKIYILVKRSKITS